MKKEKKNLVLIILAVIVIGVIIYFTIKPPILPGPEQSVERSFDVSNVYLNELITVSLDVNVAEGDNVYGIVETTPSGTEIVDLGDFSLVGGNSLRFIEFLNVTDVIKTYSVRFSSPGTYVFSGEYSFNGDSSSLQVLGETDIIISECISSSEDSDSTCSDGLDNDCDHLIDCEDSDCVGTFSCVSCTDLDADGYGNPASAACTKPELDCDDDPVTGLLINPSMDEVCDGIDNNCVNGIDENPGDLCVGAAKNCVAGSCECQSSYGHDSDCSGCINTSEIVNYVTAWLGGGTGDLETIVSTINDWVTGVSACAV